MFNHNQICLELVAAASNPLISCNSMLIFWIGKGFLTNLLFTSQKSLKKRTVLSFLGIMKKMAKPIQMQAASLIPPVCTISPPLFWWCLYGFLVLGLLGHGRVILPPLIGMRLAWSSSHLRCCQRATLISWVAAVTSFADCHLDACNCLWQLTGDLLFGIWRLESA